MKKNGAIHREIEKSLRSVCMEVQTPTEEPDMRQEILFNVFALLIKCGLAAVLYLIFMFWGTPDIHDGLIGVLQSTSKFIEAQKLTPQPVTSNGSDSLQNAATEEGFRRLEAKRQAQIQAKMKVERW